MKVKRLFKKYLRNIENNVVNYNGSSSLWNDNVALRMK